MKYSLIFIPILLFFNSFLAQDSTAISESGTWVVRKQFPVSSWDYNCNCAVWSTDENWKMYKTDGDTVINATTYKKLSVWPLGYNNGEYISPWPAGGTYKLAYRNDNDLKAYRILSDSSSEELWYNFNLQIGDSIDATNPQAAYSSATIYVEDIDSTTFCDSIYNQFHFYDVPGQPIFPEKKSVQRIGCLSNLIDDNWIPGIKYDVTFFCESPTSVSDLYNLTSIEDEKSPLNFIIYPNPSSEYIRIRDYGIMTSQTTGYILDLYGKVVLSVNNMNEPINIKSLSAGMYYLHIQQNYLLQSIPFVKE